MFYDWLRPGVRSVQDDAVKQLSELARAREKKLPQATVKEFFVVQHGALAEELAHMAEVGVLFQTHTSSCASCAGSCCPVPPL